MYQEFSSYEGAFYHFIIGVVCFLITLISIILNDEFIKAIAMNWVTKEKKNKWWVLKSLQIMLKRIFVLLIWWRWYLGYEKFA